MRTSCLALLLLVTSHCFSQPDSQFVYTDTLVLNADNCDWVIRSFVKNDSLLLLRKGKSLPAVILEEAMAGRLKLRDPITKEAIAPDRLMVWNMPSDTVMVDDGSGKAKYKVVQHQLDPASFSRIRIISDWFFDVRQGSFINIVKWLDLLAEVKSYTGEFLGYKSFFRLYY